MSRHGMAGVDILTGSGMAGASLMTGTNKITSNWVDCGNCDSIGFHAVWTGTPTGSFVVEYSDDPSNTPGFGDSTGPLQSTSLDFDTVQGSSISVAGAAGKQGWQIAPAAHRWYRLAYTNTSGTGTVTKVQATTKGAG